MKEMKTNLSSSKRADILQDLRDISATCHYCKEVDESNMLPVQSDLPKICFACAGLNKEFKIINRKKFKSYQQRSKFSNKIKSIRY